MKILVDKLPKNPSDCIFNIRNECYITFRADYWDGGLDITNCGECDVAHCKYLMSIDDVDKPKENPELTFEDFQYLDREYVWIEEIQIFIYWEW